MLRHLSLAISFALLIGSQASAENWAAKMFETSDHDFGVVARGSKTEFHFPITNPYAEDVHIASIRSSCGCTTPIIVKPWLKANETGSILAHINTDRFLGSKGATLTVIFDKPYRTQIQLRVKVYIRSDIIFTPGSVYLGIVESGDAAEKTVNVSYAGRSDWQIQGVRCDNPHITAEVTSTIRTRGRIGYQIKVHVDKELPAGYVNDHLILLTNDRKAPQVPLLVEGIVRPGITVSPASLFMGTVQPGAKVTKQLVIRGKKPFRVVSIDCDSASFEFKASEDSTPKLLHLVPVTFTAGADQGKVLETIRIVTDLGDSAPELSAYAVVSP